MSSSSDQRRPAPPAPDASYQPQRSDPPPAAAHPQRPAPPQRPVQQANPAHHHVPDRYPAAPAQPVSQPRQAAPPSARPPAASIPDYPAVPAAAQPPLGDPQLRAHDPHTGLYHPAYDPHYGAIDNAVDAPHRPSPGPEYVPVDPVMRQFQEPAIGVEPYGWDARQQHEHERLTHYPPAPAVPDPTMQIAPERHPRNLRGLVDHEASQAGFAERARNVAALAGGAAMAAAGSLVQRIQGWRASRRARREAAAEQAAMPPAYEHADPLAEPRRRQPRKPQKLTAKERRWQRRRRRHVTEEVLGWIFVPIILVALYFSLIGGLALFGMTMDDLMDGLRVIRAQFG